MFIDNGCDCDILNSIGQSPLLYSLNNDNFDFAIELLKESGDKIDITRCDINNMSIFDFCGKQGNILLEECIEFINYVFDNYNNQISAQFLNKTTRYGKNALLTICSDFAINFYERYYYITKVNSIKYVKQKFETKKYLKNKFSTMPYEIKGFSKEEVNKSSLKYMTNFIKKSFYPLIGKMISKGCDINKPTDKKQFVNSPKYKSEYFNNYGNVTPLMYLLSFPLPDELMKMVIK